MPSKKDEIESGNPEAGNVDQIREILFGGHLRAFDERFELVESRLGKETEALRKATDKKIEDLHRLATEIRDEASDLIGAESNNRDLALNRFELALGQFRADSENQMTAMNDRFTADLKQVRVEMKAMHKELSSVLTKADREQQKVAGKLGEEKVARQDLASLFRKLADTLQPQKTSRSK